MDFVSNERGDTNLVSIVILTILLVVGLLLFYPYILQLADWISSFFL